MNWVDELNVICNGFQIRIISIGGKKPRKRERKQSREAAKREGMDMEFFLFSFFNGKWIY